MKRYYSIFLVVILLVATLCLSACRDAPADNADSALDTALMRASGEKLMEKLPDSVQNIDLTSARDHSTVHIKQSLSDGRTMYLSLDVIYHDAADLDLNVETPSPNLLEFSVEKIEQQEFEAMGPTQRQYLLRTANPFNIKNIGCKVTAVDTQSNTVSYMFTFSGRDEDEFEVEEITFLIGDFFFDSKDTVINAPSDVHIFSWHPENKVKNRFL